MPYYQGDYYKGGILDVFKNVAGAALGSIPVVGTVYNAARTVAGLASSTRSTPSLPQIPAMPAIAATSAATIVPKPGMGVSVKPSSGKITAAEMKRALGGTVGRRKGRMNVTNPRALRRAIRRQAGFVKLARKALKGTGYTIVSRGSTRKRMVVKESGPGSVTVQ